MKLVKTDNGFTFRAGTADEWILREGGYKRLLNHIEPGDQVLDAGGYIGTFAVWAKRRGADVFSYEPSLDNFKVLSINAEKYGFKATRAALITDDAGGVTFYEATGETQLPYGSLLRKGRNYRPVEVPAVNIVKVQKMLHPRWVKVDVEGVECQLTRALDWSMIDGFAIEYDLRRRGQREDAVSLDDELRDSRYGCETRRVADHSLKLRSTVKIYIKEY